MKESIKGTAAEFSARRMVKEYVAKVLCKCIEKFIVGIKISEPTRKPCILIVTPEVTYLPQDMGDIANYLNAKAGGLADVSASLISTLFEMGADVHVAMPDYRTLFNDQFTALIRKELKTIRSRIFKWAYSPFRCYNCHCVQPRCILPDGKTPSGLPLHWRQHLSRL